MKSISNVPQNLDEIRSLLKDLPQGNQEALRLVNEREPLLTKPRGSLGRLEGITQWVAQWQPYYQPKMENIRVAVFCGQHGVCEEGVSAFPSSVNAQMVQNFLKGGAAINQITQVMGAELKIFEVALEQETQNFCREPAMSEYECLQAMAFGMSAVEPGLDLICLGEMGIGNTTSAAAVCHAMYGGDAALWTGRGTGVDDEGLKRKQDVVGRGVKKHQDSMKDGLDILRCLGGREMAAMVGAIIAARYHQVPVVLDGFISTACASILTQHHPGALDHCLCSHQSQELGHAALLEKLNKKALVDFGMRLGEGSGASLVIGIIKAAIACHNQMATFEQASVSEGS